MLREREREREGECVCVCVCVCVCNFAIVGRHEKRLRRIRVYCHLWPVRLLPCFFVTSPQKRHGFRKKNVEHRIRVLIFSAVPPPQVPHSEKNSAKYYHKCTHVLMLKYQLFLSVFNKSWIFVQFFEKCSKYEMLRKSVQWEPSCSVRTGGQTLRSNSRSFANAPENVLLFS